MSEMTVAEQLKTREELKKTITDMYNTAKEAGDMYNMYEMLVELGDQGLISEKDVRIQPAAMQKFIDALGPQLAKPIFVNTELREKYAEMKRQVAGKKKSGARSVNANGEATTGVDYYAMAAKKRAEAAVCKSHGLIFKAVTYEHVGQRIEYGLEGNQIMTPFEIPISIYEVKTSHAALKCLDDRDKVEKYRFEHALLKDRAIFKKQFDDEMATMLDITPASESLSIGRLGLVDVRYDLNGNVPVARAKVVFNLERMMDRFIVIQDFVDKSVNAIREVLQYRKGVPCQVHVKLAGPVKKYIETQRNVKNQAYQEIVAFKLTRSGEEVDAEIAKKKAEERKKKAEEKAAQKAMEREARRAEREAMGEIEKAERAERAKISREERAAAKAAEAERKAKARAALYEMATRPMKPLSELGYK